MFGVIAAVPTPINNNGNPILDTFIDHCEWVLQNGCDGVNILGSTGEANSFNSHQRKLVMESASQNLNNQRLMVGTGTPSISETIHLTQIADDLNYQVALVLPPFYYKPITNNGLFLWYQTLHEQLGSQKIKIYFYNFPQMTGLIIPIEVIEQLHNQWPNRFCGIKDSSGDLNYCRALSKNKNFKVFPSSEVSISEAHISKFSGCISATANQTLFLSSKAWAKKNENIDYLVSKINHLREEISKDSLIPSIKFLVFTRTKNKDWNNLLPPFNSLHETRQKYLTSLYDKSLS
jgi:4-hydroxy-tetrahydrodipicolinate synthase